MTNKCWKDLKWNSIAFFPDILNIQQQDQHLNMWIKLADFMKNQLSYSLNQYNSMV